MSAKVSEHSRRRKARQRRLHCPELRLTLRYHAPASVAGLVLSTPSSGRGTGAAHCGHFVSPQLQRRRTAHTAASTAGHGPDGPFLVADRKDGWSRAPCSEPASSNHGTAANRVLRLCRRPHGARGSAPVGDLAFGKPRQRDQRRGEFSCRPSDVGLRGNSYRQLGPGRRDLTAIGGSAELRFRRRLRCQRGGRGAPGATLPSMTAQKSPAKPLTKISCARDTRQRHFDDRTAHRMTASALSSGVTEVGDASGSRQASILPRRASQSIRSGTASAGRMSAAACAQCGVEQPLRDSATGELRRTPLQEGGDAFAEVFRRETCHHLGISLLDDGAEIPK